MVPQPWGEVLQQPNINTDLGGVDRRTAMWMQRQGEMQTAQQAAIAQLTTALAAGRDKSMAAAVAAAAAAAAKASGGGRGRGGGGGSGGGVLVPTPQTLQPSWVDQYLAQMPNGAAPGYTPPNPNAPPVNPFAPTSPYSDWYVAKPKPVPKLTPTVPSVPGSGTTSYTSRAYSVAHPLGVGVLPAQPREQAPTAYAPSRLS